MDYLYIFGCILFTVYGQLIVKWQVADSGALPEGLAETILFLLRLLFNPWIISGIAAGFLAMLSWMAAMARFQLSYAYPFMSLAFVLVLGLSALIFREPLTATKIIGMILIIVGVAITSRG
jgi:multidrug transporter EmrE-like cation transporter